MKKATQNLYIIQLEVSMQKAIRKELKKALKKLELDKEEYNEALENGMSSRILDLEDTININKFFNKGEY